MINLEKIKLEKCQLPSFLEDLPLHHTSTPFLKFFRVPPPGEAIKIGIRGLSYVIGWRCNIWLEDWLCCTIKLTWRSSALVVFSINIWYFRSKSSAELADVNMPVVTLELFTKLVIFLCAGQSQCLTTSVLPWWSKECFSCMGCNRMHVYFGLLVQLGTQLPTIFDTCIYMTSSTSLALKVRLVMIFCPRVIRWFCKRKRQNNMLHCHFGFAFWSMRLIHWGYIAKLQKVLYNFL